ASVQSMKTMELACLRRDSWRNIAGPGLSGVRVLHKALEVVPGGGVEPPRAEARRILSPLRLPVPPSRHFVEVTYYKYYTVLYPLPPENIGCATVKESVKVSGDFHRLLSFCQ